tara:strand:- start:159 stop:386 length:228 start_codon:yes stop_codon:yes gene_type:complete
LITPKPLSHPYFPFYKINHHYYIIAKKVKAIKQIDTTKLKTNIKTIKMKQLFIINGKKVMAQSLQEALTLKNQAI